MSNDKKVETDLFDRCNKRRVKMIEREYLMSIQCYFGGEKRFQVSAFNKESAIEKAKRTQFYRDDNTISGTLKCVRKLKPSFGKVETV